MVENYDLTQERHILEQIIAICQQNNVGLILPAYLETKEKKTQRPSIRVTCSRLFNDDDIKKISTELNNALDKVLGR